MSKSTGYLPIPLLFFITFLLTIPLSAQTSNTLFYDTFEDMSNWTPVGPQGLQSWEMSNSNNAGGQSAPEIRFNWIYPFIGESYLLADPVFYEIQGHNLELRFNYYEDWWSNIVYVGVAITGDGGSTYTSIWELQASGNSGPELVTVYFTGIANMQVALYYLGDSNDIDFWYVDDFTLTDLDAVPVELTSFTASAINGKVNLEWATATETNNKGFEIQRSVLEDSFVGVRGQRSEWMTLGFVEGYGTTSESHSYSYSDDNINSGNYSYRLKQIDYNGSFEYSDIVNIGIDNAPGEFVLEQNYPNPFNPTTKITFSLPDDSRVILNLYDVLGQKVRSLLNTDLTAGKHTLNFDASGLNSGTYFYRIDTEEVEGNKYSLVKKMILMK